MAATPPKLVRVDFKPGINRELTAYSGTGGWYDADMVRFRYSRPEKIGGWQDVNGVGASATFNGTCRNLWNWTALDGAQYTGIGTNTKLEVWLSPTYSDITPIRVSLSATSIFSTSAGSTDVIVSIVGHGATQGSSVFFTSVNTTVGGVAFTGEYVVTSVIGSDSFTVSVTTAAAATSASGGGPTTGYFLLNIGTTDSQQGTGYGTGSYGRGGYGTAATATSGPLLRLRTWSLDNWGEDLVACPRPQGAIYYWDKTSGTDVRAYQVTSAPTQADYVIVSPEDRHLIALGTLDAATSAYNPLYIRWCSQENINDWAASSTNTAGDKLLSGATRITGVQRARGQILIWTEDALYGMQHAGPPFTFAFNHLGAGCGLMGPNGMVEVGGRTFWMADQKFMIYDGAAPRPIKCDVLRHVFDNLDTAQLDKITAASNAEFNEVIWFYQSTSATEVDKCVAYNYLEDLWWIGTLARTAWADRGVYGQPIGAGADGHLYFHEVGTDANGSALAAHIESNEFDMSDGQQVIFNDRMIPDFSDRDGSALTGNLDYSIKYRPYPGATQQTKGPYTVSAATQKVDHRVRGRQIAIRVDSSGTGQSWRFGSLRFRIAPDGER